MVSDEVCQHLTSELAGLMQRIRGVPPVGLTETMVPAAAPPGSVLAAIAGHLDNERRELEIEAHRFGRWLGSHAADNVSDEQAQRRYTILRLAFVRQLTHLDLFSDVLTQRSETGNGVLLAGLDVAAVDALWLADSAEAPPVITYLDRGVGAAIRRARTRLPGGGSNPVAIIRIPRERMVSYGVASSLVHEVGHQSAALLDLVGQLRSAMAAHPRASTAAWRYWQRCISEIVADLWSVGRVGVASTLGLIGVVSLPAPFVFRLRLDDPHPAPWLRVQLSAAIGAGLYPDRQWARLQDLWRRLYPLRDAPAAVRPILDEYAKAIPPFIEFLIEFRPTTLDRSLGEHLATADREPRRLRNLGAMSVQSPDRLARLPPTRALAVVGQRRADGQLDAKHEAEELNRLLTHWARGRALNPDIGPAHSPSHQLPSLTFPTPQGATT